MVPEAGGSQAFRWDREPVVCGYRKLTNHDRRTGSKVTVPVSATPAVVSEVGVVVGSDDGYVRFFSRGLDRLYWERRLNSGIYASLVVDRRRRHVVVISTAGLAVCFDLRGNLVWSAETGAPVCATPVVLPGSDLLVIAAFHSRCVGLNLETGERVFDRNLPRPWHAEHGGTASYRDPYASPVGTADGYVIICCAEDVLCLRPDGTEVWCHRADEGIKASPVALHATAEVVVCLTDGRCLFLDSRTGTRRADLSVGGKVTASPAVSGGIIAVGTAQGRVIGLEVSTRRPAWEVDDGAPRAYTSFSVLPTGDFVATTARGNVVCLNAADGRFRWESSQVLGLAEHEPEMDISPVAGPDGRMYCASYSGDVYEFRFRPMAPSSEGAPLTQEDMSCR
ncbi:outer membrane protein assembly factor BamB family protein [Streptomyces olivaceus]|uniref:outer membrane protein assembly factor BamB family protein n=1 Tax=Streptomyces olivaceus TaxID=47716 RepID=UPI001884E203|nr:PQQ-binding-like beta-propeller repeat protein [Streptomyces olivaceus]